MTSLDDLTLLQLFASGDATLEANQSLHVQPANDLRQLLGRKGLLLATAYDAAMPPRIEVRRDTDYTAVLHQVLLDHHFVPIGQELDSQVLCYAYSPVPQGYHLNYTPARQLWKQWWIRSNRQAKRKLQLDLFVLTKNKWYPVRDIGLSSGTLYVETLRGETAHHGDDMVVWLEKDTEEEADKTRILASPAAAPSPATQTQPVDASSQSPSTPAPTVAPASVLLTDPVLKRATPTMASVVCTREGKVYVKTAAGVLVIEGDNLKAYSLAHRRAAVSMREPPRVFHLEKCPSRRCELDPVGLSR